MRPSRADLQSARDREVPDLVAPRLPLLVCGINPGLWSGYRGLHFAGPGNRLWPALALAGITTRRLAPAETAALLEAGVGITNLVARSTATAAELAPDELRAGRARLEALVARLAPGALAMLGLGAYRTAFGRRAAGLGRQEEPVAGVPVWVAPNPSGLQARYGVEVIAGVLREAHAEGAVRLGRPGSYGEGAPGTTRAPTTGGAA